MTFDSEAIFALAEEAQSAAAALEELRGSMASAWLDERRAEVVYLARGVGRPLWLGKGARELFFASTERALEIVERHLGLRLQKRELEEGTLVSLCRGRELGRERFNPNRSFDEKPLPAVRAPDEGDFCLRRLAALAAG